MFELIIYNTDFTRSRWREICIILDVPMESKRIALGVSSTDFR